MKLVLVVTCLFAVGMPAARSDDSLAGVLAGSAGANPVRLRDIGADGGDWRRITVAYHGDMSALIGMMSGAPQDTYYTRGATVEAGGEQYLLVYAPPRKARDMASLMRRGPGAPPAEVERLTPETPVRLSLLNLRTTGDITEIGRFDLEREIGGSEEQRRLADDAKARADEAASLSNLKQLALATLMYANDYDERYPPMKSPAQFRNRVMPYVRNASVFVVPRTGKPYQPNAAYSGLAMRKIGRPAEVVILYEPEPGSDGRRGVAYADGHARRLTAAEWEAARRSSKIR